MIFTDAEAGAKTFPDSTARRYNYYTPQKRKQSHYEDVTVDVQPDPDGGLAGDGGSPADAAEERPPDRSAERLDQPPVEEELPARGLKRVTVDGQTFWIPDVE